MNNKGRPGRRRRVGVAYDDCQRFVSLVNAAGGTAKMLHLPEQGLRGNSHVMMMDKNNMRVADLLIDWIKKVVAK